MVRSVYEKRVDDWLTDHNLEHEYEQDTPFPSRWRADFRVGPTYIEVWGVRGRSTYDTKKREKAKAYQQHEIPLIELPYWIFSTREKPDLERRLTPLLHQSISGASRLTTESSDGLERTCPVPVQDQAQDHV